MHLLRLKNPWILQKVNIFQPEDMGNQFGDAELTSLTSLFLAPMYEWSGPGWEGNAASNIAELTQQHRVHNKA